jgi:hypothetical protein
MITIIITNEEYKHQVKAWDTIRIIILKTGNDGGGGGGCSGGGGGDDNDDDDDGPMLIYCHSSPTSDYESITKRTQHESHKNAYAWDVT